MLLPCYLIHLSLKNIAKKFLMRMIKMRARLFVPEAERNKFFSNNKFFRKNLLLDLKILAWEKERERDLNLFLN